MAPLIRACVLLVAHDKLRTLGPSVVIETSRYYTQRHDAEKITMSVPTQPIDGFYYDELSQIRVLEPQVAAETVELKEECKEFVESWFLNNAHPTGITYLCHYPFPQK